ncbi:LOW QUALITY PROTEIN: proton-associated sugar transporter A-like [Pollicipes pollicipes]|uniref:LOW QUALITY PROTEIN: proton-associated sugar transporter A-like n=1 Tax=Pollicipes pollicipes TaxID=41117 RepID=UPI0018855602|nr:LOW QUALITY PROTEIN: proton-associated sugar transporter A-like [Pollicipes pollicipes]
MEKLNDYTGGYWRIQAIKEAWHNWRERRRGDPEAGVGSGSGSTAGRIRDWIVTRGTRSRDGDYSHVYRTKTRAELLRISAAVMGIEFCYAAETAFVSPTLLSIGVLHSHMTLIWCLSPLVGFFLTPVLGSMSDRCRSPLGRRRPFVLLLSVGIVLGLILVPNGALIGQALGDQYDAPAEPRVFTGGADQPDVPAAGAGGRRPGRQYHTHPWGIFFTIVGTVLLDFDSDACQSPARAFLLDITVPEDHARGLSTFTIMAGLGGALGYAMGGINWDATVIGEVFGGHVRAVFTLVLFIYIACLMTTLCSFPEIPLDLINAQLKEDEKERNVGEGEVMLTVNPADEAPRSYGTVTGDTSPAATDLGETSFMTPQPSRPKVPELPSPGDEPRVTLKEYLLSIVYMPASLRVLCVTNLFCWMSLVCYSLYFTDFVGEAVFGGNPQAAVGSESRSAYEDGVRFGCWGMAIYSLSCSVYSFLIESLVRKFRARPVYVGGQLVYAVGMVFMATLRHRVAVIVFSACAGVMYSTLFTMPYLLVAHYHVSGSFAASEGSDVRTSQVRGLGTDVAIVSSMVFLAQFVLSLCVGSIVTAAGTTTMVVIMASVLSTCGAITATQVTYLDL